MADTSTLSVRLIPQTQYATPTTGTTINVNTNGFVRLLINPVGTLLALTVTLPASPQDGDLVNLASTQAVTGLTMNGGTIIGALTTLAIGTFATYTYSSSSSEWFRTS